MGSFIAQVVTFIIAPIITRIYTVDEIGVYSFAMTVVNIFGSAICARYDMLIVSEQNDDKVYTIIKLSIITCFIFSILVTTLYSLYCAFFVNDVICDMFIFIAIFIVLLLTGITNILNSYNNRKREYPIMTKANIVKTVSKDACSVILGVLGLGKMGLIISQAIGSMIGIIRQSKSIMLSAERVFRVSYKELAKTAKENYKQPLFSTPAIFANNFSYSSINMFIESLFGLSVLGYYSFSFRVLGMPLSLLSNNVSKVFFEQASSEYKNCGNYKKTFFKTSIFLLALAVPMTILLYFAAPYLFECFFGRGWYEAGVYVRVLSPMFGIRFIVSALTPVMIISRKQNLELGIQVIFVFVSICAYVYSKIAFIDVLCYLKIICLSFTIVYAIYYFIMCRLSVQYSN